MDTFLIDAIDALDESPDVTKMWDAAAVLFERLGADHMSFGVEFHDDPVEVVVHSTLPPDALAEYMSEGVQAADPG